jgi:aspartyl/asparaginyl beta-hydroxylase (cupin superfamily)
MSIINSIGRKIVILLEKILMIGADDKPLLPLINYPELLEIEHNYLTILNEYIQYHNQEISIPFMDELSTSQKKIVEPEKWKSLILLIYGNKIESNNIYFKNTFTLLEKIPGVKTAFFSVFLPNTYLKPHRGPYKGVLRYHLGLIIPETSNTCAIKINNEIYYWKVGQSLLFDDTYMHEAWNYTDKIRVILFIDVERKLMFPFNKLNKLFLFIISKSPFVNEIFTKSNRH